MRFERDLRREEHGRTCSPWKGKFAGAERSTLANYFLSYPGMFYRPGPDGVFRTDPGYAEAMGVDMQTLSYEQQCETTDVLHGLIGGMMVARLDAGDPVPMADVKKVMLLLKSSREDPDDLQVLKDLCLGHSIWPEDMILGAQWIVEFLAWSSRNAYHAQSIEGDYELFDQFERDWLRTQGPLPRFWTRSALRMIRWSLIEDYEAFLDELFHFMGSAENAKRDPRPVVDKQQIDNAKRFLQILGVKDEDLHPILADFFV